MKSTILTFCLLTVLILSNTAQDVRFGVYAAPQFSWLSPESKDVNSDGSIVKFSGGLTMNKYFAKNYAFSTGISIASQGGKVAYEETSTDSLDVYDTRYGLANKSIRYDLQYINVPIGLKLQSNEVGYLRFHVLIGFTNQFKIGAKATDLSDDEFNDDSIKDEVALYNLGYHFGGGIDYALGEDTSVFLSIVYENGFTEVFKSGASMNSRVISARVGLNF